MHIYTISRVYKQKAAIWNRLLEEARQKRDFMFHGYRPLREALVREMKTDGSGLDYLEEAFAAPSHSKQERTIRLKSLDAMSIFIEVLRPQFGGLRRNFIGDGREEMARWGEFHLSGGFHFTAEGPDRNEVFVYGFASDWKAPQREAFLELLAIVAEIRYNADRNQVWFLDLLNGKIIHPSKTFKKVRRELQETLEHLTQLRRLLDMEEAEQEDFEV